MALTYTEIEEQKNTRIFIFFAVVLLFYFFTALVLANTTKMFFVWQMGFPKEIKPFLSAKTTMHILVFAFVAAAIHIYFSITNAMSLIQKTLKAQQVDLTDKYHKRFHNILEEVNVAVGNKYKITPIVIPTVAMNAFAISDYSGNATVGVTEGLLSKLNRQQLQAVVAHEVAHVASGDSFQTTVGCSLFAIYAAILNGIKNTFRSGRVRLSGRGSGGAILFIGLIYLVLSTMQFFYALVRFTLSRDRELRADAISVRITRDPISLSEALYAISRGWRGLGFIDENLEAIFIMNPLKADRDEQEGLWANLFSTHPPIKKRMQVLANMAHADVANIQAQVVSQEKIKEAAKEIVSEKEKPQWMFMHDQNQWQGPFTAVQMMALGWLRPDTWIKPLNSEILLPAKDEPLLQPLFNQKTQQFKASSFNCPKCNQALIDEEYEGVTILRCLFCAGVLLKSEKMPRIMVRCEKGFDQRLKKLADLTQQNGLQKMRSEVKDNPASFLKCPNCSATMLRSFYTLAYFVQVDRCNMCGLIWFDKDELEIVQYLIENKLSAKL